MIKMKILAKEIVSNSEMIKQYKACREKAESLGKIFILKNNQPDAVLFSITEYERISEIIEHFESLDKVDFDAYMASLPKKGNRNVYSIENLKNDISDLNGADYVSDLTEEDEKPEKDEEPIKSMEMSI